MGLMEQTQRTVISQYFLVQGFSSLGRKESGTQKENKMNEDYLIIYLIVNAVLTLFNFVMVWVLIRNHDANVSGDEQ